jgi:hypothetical protein
MVPPTSARPACLSGYTAPRTLGLAQLAVLRIDSLTIHFHPWWRRIRHDACLENRFSSLVVNVVHGRLLHKSWNAL